MVTRCVLHRAAALAAIAATAGLLSCSGGSSPPPYAQYASKCAVPRPGVDQQGTLTDEKNFLRAWTDDLYLWYRDVDARTDLDPTAYATAEAYFDVLKTPLKTASNNDKDRFHFFMSTTDWQAFVNSGQTVTYGIQFVVLAATPPRDVRIGYVESGSPGAKANLVRGTQIIAIDGAMVSNGDPAVLNAGLGPTSTSPTHHFEVRLPGASTDTFVDLTAVNFTENPVPIVQVFPGAVPGTNVGYILFNDVIATSESLLVDAVKTLSNAQVNELVLDLRYNGGGYGAIASELAYMISGPNTRGKTFEKLTFNDKHPTTDPVTGAPLLPTPFLITGQGFSVARNVLLPTLGLTRVFVLTGPGTCSASELIMNGLAGVDVQVVQIGRTTCGKPYGFYPWDNCATTYFSIMFQSVNAKGFGDYTDGFVPGGTGAGIAGLPGCLMDEDFTHELGDPNDARIVAAMNWAANPGTCPAPPAAQVAASPQTALSFSSSAGAIRAKPPWRESRIMTPDQADAASAPAP